MPISIININRGTVSVNNKKPTSVTLTQVALTATPTTIASDRSAAQNRGGISIENYGSTNALIAYGTSVTATTRLFELYPGELFEDPYLFQGPFVARASGSAATINVTELVVI